MVVVVLICSEGDRSDFSVLFMCMSMVVAYVQLSEKCLDAFDEGAPVVVDMPNGQ